MAFYFMRKIFWAGCILFTFLSCRGDDTQNIQKIDQVLQMYMKNSAGQDLLNKNIAGSYVDVTLKDIGGIKDQTSISGYSLKKTTDPLSYLEYTAGAKRNLVDSVSPDYKTYRSDIAIHLKKKNSDSVDLDTLTIFYEWTPQIFQVKSVNYNQKPVFSKTSALTNTFTVVK